MFHHVIVLNWNSASETVECLENLFEARTGAKIIVVDNSSADESISQILEWASSRVEKFYHLKEADLGKSTLSAADYDFLLISNSGNYGFAGGNNTAIKYAVQRSGGGFIWLLNNDARVNGDTFPALVRRFDSEERLGFVGSILCHYDTPDVIQCFGGGVIHSVIGKRKLYGKGCLIKDAGKLHEAEVDYLMGASLMIRSELIHDVGVMEDAYFMYSEELDWQLRAKEKGWEIGVARDSLVFHKGAASTSGRSHMYHYYLNRASVMFSTRFFGRVSLATVVPSLLAIIAVQNWRTPRNILFGWKGVFEGAAFKWEQQHPFPYRKKE